MWNLKKKKKMQIKLFTKQKQAHRHGKQAYGYQRGNGGEMNWEFGIDVYTLLYLK